MHKCTKIKNVNNLLGSTELNLSTVQLQSNWGWGEGARYRYF